MDAYEEMIASQRGDEPVSEQYHSTDGLGVIDPSVCPCGNKYLWCDNPACIDAMCETETNAYCQHGFLVGCPTCKKLPNVNEEVRYEIF